MLSAFIPSNRHWAMAAMSMFAAFTTPAQAGFYDQTNLVSNISGLATITDPTLVNPWGFSHSATSPFWISDQGTNSSTLYTVTGPTAVAKVPINAPSGLVGIPTIAGVPNGPTGQVSNSNSATFLLGSSNARFIFADLNGSIAAWNGGANATIKYSNPPGTTAALFTGLAINQAQTLLYAANSAVGGGIQVFDSTFAATSLGANAFATPAAISQMGFVTFNVQDLNGKVYVTYAPAGRTAQTGATSGQGAVAVFDEAGNLLQVYTGPEFAAPWGVALAPSTFGMYGGDLLVGNFSFNESEINAIDPVTGALMGTITIDTDGHGPGGLWQIGFGTGVGNGDPNTLYFTDGIDGERNGLFGALTVPEPFTLSVFGAGLAGVMALRRRRSRETAS
jgi:uncharacterized protein (TIGR03118 family)